MGKLKIWRELRRESHRVRGLLWVQAVGVGAAALFYGALLGGSYRLVMGFAAVAALAWALWAASYRP